MHILSASLPATMGVRLALSDNGVHCYMCSLHRQRQDGLRSDSTAGVWNLSMTLRTRCTSSRSKQWPQRANMSGSSGSTMRKYSVGTAPLRQFRCSTSPGFNALSTALPTTSMPRLQVKPHKLRYLKARTTDDKAGTSSISSALVTPVCNQRFIYSRHLPRTRVILAKRVASAGCGLQCHLNTLKVGR